MPAAAPPYAIPSPTAAGRPPPHPAGAGALCCILRGASGLAKRGLLAPNPYAIARVTPLGAARGGSDAEEKLLRAAGGELWSAVVGGGTSPEWRDEELTLHLGAEHADGVLLTIVVWDRCKTSDDQFLGFTCERLDAALLLALARGKAVPICCPLGPREGAHATVDQDLARKHGGLGKLSFELRSGDPAKVGEARLCCPSCGHLQREGWTGVDMQLRMACLRCGQKEHKGKWGDGRRPTFFYFSTRAGAGAGVGPQQGGPPGAADLPGVEVGVKVPAAQPAAQPAKMRSPPRSGHGSVAVSTAPAAAAARDYTAPKTGTTVLFSARFGPGTREEEVRTLHSAVVRLGVDARMVEAGLGENYGDQTCVLLNKMCVMVAFCTSNYGEKTRARYSTHYELKYCQDYGTPIIAVQFCKDWPPDPPGPDEGAAYCKMALGPSVVRICAYPDYDVQDVARQIADGVRKLAHK